MQNLIELSEDISSVFDEPEINSSGTLTALSGIGSGVDEFLSKIGSGLLLVKCADGTKAPILKNPDKAFELYGKNWSNKFQLVANGLDQLKVDASNEIKVKIDKLFENLTFVEATLRMAYKSSYLTFAGSPCSESSQEHKRKMDRIILAASLQLTTIKLIIDMDGVNNVDNIYKLILEMNSKLLDMIIY